MRLLINLDLVEIGALNQQLTNLVHCFYHPLLETFINSATKHTAAHLKRAYYSLILIAKFDIKLKCHSKSSLSAGCINCKIEESN
jgi:hypothetical protein